MPCRPPAESYFRAGQDRPTAEAGCTANLAQPSRPSTAPRRLCRVHSRHNGGDSRAWSTAAGGPARGAASARQGLLSAGSPAASRSGCCAGSHAGPTTQVRSEARAGRRNFPAIGRICFRNHQDQQNYFLEIVDTRSQAAHRRNATALSRARFLNASGLRSVPSSGVQRCLLTFVPPHPRWRTPGPGAAPYGRRTQRTPKGSRSSTICTRRSARNS